jgi:hypothetical protein
METCLRRPKPTSTKYSNLLIGSCFSVDSLFSFQRAARFFEGEVFTYLIVRCLEKFCALNAFSSNQSIRLKQNLGERGSRVYRLGDPMRQ